MFSETAKEVLKRRGQKRPLVTIFTASKSYCENFNRVSTENLFTLYIIHYTLDIGDHPTVVKCLPIAAENFR